MSSATLYVLCARSAEDTRLTQDPTFSFWRMCYKRYSAFALETAEEHFCGGVGFGRSMSAKISSERADLIKDIDLVFTVPAIAPDTCKGVTDVHWTNALGYALIRSIKVSAGGAVLSSQYGESLYIWAELNGGAHRLLGETTGRRYTVKQLIEDAKQQRTYYVPLNLFMSNSPGNALPLVAAYQTDIEITLETRQLKDVFVSRGAPGACNVVPLRADTGSPLCDTDLQASLYVTYVFLGYEERQYFHENPHTYVIEQVQTTRAQPFAAAGSNLQGAFSVALPFNGPVRDMAWVLQSDEAARGKNLFHYGDVKTGSDMLHSATIRLKGSHDLFEPKGYLWFRAVQPARALGNVPDKHIYYHSFGVDGKHAQPSGSANIGMLQPAFLDITLQQAAYNVPKSFGRFKGVEPQTVYATVYARVLKELKFAHGRASIAYC